MPLQAQLHAPERSKQKGYNEEPLGLEGAPLRGYLPPAMLGCVAILGFEGKEGEDGC